MQPSARVRAFLAWARGPVAGPFLATRVLLIGFAWLTLGAIPMGVAPWQAFPDTPLLDGWLRWDSGWYLTIAREGYRVTPGGGEANVAFFPLYPLAALAVSLPLRPFLAATQAIALGGLLVTHAAFFAALAGIHRLAARRLDPESAGRAVWLVCLFPFSVFHAAFYAEPLLLALAAWTFVAADGERWGRAAVFAGLAVLTRVPGLIVCAALAAEYLARRGWKIRAIGRDAWPVAVAPLAIGVLLVHHGLRFGDPLVMFHVRGSGWHRPPGLHILYSEVRGLLFSAGPIACTGVLPCLQSPDGANLVIGCLNLATIPAALWLSWRAARRLGVGLGLYALGAMAATLIHGLEDTGRVVSTVFPAFIALADVARDRAFFRALCLVSIPLLLLLTFYFTHWLHVT